LKTNDQCDTSGSLFRMVQRPPSGLAESFEVLSCTKAEKGAYVDCRERNWATIYRIDPKF